MHTLGPPDAPARSRGDAGQRRDGLSAGSVTVWRNANLETGREVMTVTRSTRGALDAPEPTEFSGLGWSAQDTEPVLLLPVPRPRRAGDDGRTVRGGALPDL